MLKIRTILILAILIFPALSAAKVVEESWLETTDDHLNQTPGTIVDVIIPGSSKLPPSQQSTKEEVGSPTPPFSKNPGTEDFGFTIKSNSNFKIEKKETRPSLLSINKTYSKRIPTMSFRKTIPKECQPEKLDKSLDKTRSSEEHINLIRNYFARCGKSLDQTTRIGVLDMLKLGLKKYNIFSNKENIHRFQLKFDYGSTATGYLALKKDKRRPLVIIKCGIFCSGGNESTNVNMLATIFDSGPFNAIVLSNHTGPLNIAINKRVSIGGIFEGQEILDVAHWAKTNPNIANYIAEVHVVGISLGGQAALYTALYNDHLDEKIISSVIGYCPVVNIERSKDNMLSGIKGEFAGREVHKIIQNNYDNMPALHKYFRKDEEFKLEGMKEKIADLNVDFLRDYGTENLPRPLKGIPMNNRADFYHAGDFLNHLDKMKTPIFVWASENDFIVKEKQNVRHLAQAYPNPNDNIDIGTLTTKEGGHCATSEAYGWQTVSKILNNFLVKHSPSLKKTVRRAPFKVKKPWLFPGEEIVSERLLTMPNYSKVIIDYRIFYRNPWSQKDYTRSVKIRVPMSQFPFDIKPPADTTSARILTRYLNQNTRLISNDQLSVYTDDPVTNIEWEEFKNR